MNTLSEVIKVFDVEPFQVGDGDAFRFRLEVVRELGAEIYKGKVYRLETYRLQPTFPQSEGSLPDWKNDALIYVVDDMFNTDSLLGNSVQEVIDKFRKAFDDFFQKLIIPQKKSR
jgi:hypothetical protein